MLAATGADGAFPACLEVAPPDDALRVQGVTERGEPVLSDGRIVLPSGIALVDEAAAVAAIRKVLDRGEIRLAAISRHADRWGRYRGHLAIRAGGDVTTLVEHLVAQGAALLYPQEIAAKAGDKRNIVVTAACADRLLSLEKEARRAGIGAWGGTAALPLDARNIPLLQRFAGQYVIVEGRVVSVGERSTMTFLNFGSNWRRDFSVSIARKDWEDFAKQGLTAAALDGRRVAVRGEILLREGVESPAGRAPTIRVSVTRSLAYSDTD